MPFYHTLFALLLIGFLSACSGLPEEDEETKGWSASQFYKAATESLAEGEYDAAIRYYEGLEARYPFGRFAMQSQLDVAYAYYKYDEPDSAIAAADRFIKLHPQNEFVDYAYYLKGIVNFNRSIGLLDRFIPTDASQRDPGSSKDAFDDFMLLTQKFPNSRYAEDSRQRLVYLRDNLANTEVHAARYYLKRGAYIAAVNRANTVIERFQKTTAVKPALEIMVSAYNKMGLETLAADTQRVLDLNVTQNRLPDNQLKTEEKSLGRRIWEFIGMDQN